MPNHIIVHSEQKKEKRNEMANLMMPQILKRVVTTDTFLSIADLTLDNSLPLGF
jgi:hypothetical protein